MESVFCSFVGMLLLFHFEGRVEPTGTTATSPNSPGPSNGTETSKEKIMLSLLVFIAAVTVIFTLLIFSIVILVLKRRVTPTKLNQSGVNFQEGFPWNYPTCMVHDNEFDPRTVSFMRHQHHHLTRDAEDAAGVVSRISSTSSDDSSDNITFGPWLNSNVRASKQNKDYINVFPEASTKGNSENMTLVLGARCNDRWSPGEDYENIKEQLRQEDKKNAGLDHVKTEVAFTRLCRLTEDKENGEINTGDDMHDWADDGDEDDGDDDGFVNYTTVVFHH